MERKRWLDGICIIARGAGATLVGALASGVFVLALSAILTDTLHIEGESGGDAGPLPVFTDITRQSGLAFRITNGDADTEFLIDVNGQGACLLDFNHDGFQDVFLVNGSARKLEQSGQHPHDYLLRNNGDGTFSDITEISGLGASGWHCGCAVGDYNNDGFDDLLVTNYGPNLLYRNNGNGTFSKVAALAGVAGPEWNPPKWSMGAAFGDYDGDGRLDLYVANFVKFNIRTSPPPPSESSPCKLKDVPIVCAPEFFEAQQDLLYHNNGDGTFTDVSQAAGVVRKDPGRGFAVALSDFDNDGHPDIYVANDSGPNHYYSNNGDGTFTDASWGSGTSADFNGQPQGSMGLTVGDYNRDGLMDIFITNFIDQYNTLYENQGAHLFLDATTGLNLGRVGFEYSGWGTKFFDFDNDGWLDLWVTNGHTDERLEKRNPADSYAEPNYLLRNLEGGKFVDVSEAAGIRKLTNRVGRGTAFGDLENDGDIDVLVINKNDFPYLLRNDGGIGHRWLAIRTEGVKSNRDGIGARIVVKAAGPPRVYEVRNSDSFLSANDLRVTVGLGALNRADAIEIHWPSGQIDRHPNVAANQFYLAREGAALTSDPWVRKESHR